MRSKLTGRLKENQNKDNEICSGMKKSSTVVKICSRKFEWLLLILILLKNKLTSILVIYWWILKARTFLKKSQDIFLQSFITTKIVESIGELSKNYWSHTFTYRSSRREKFLENSATFNNRQITMFNIILLRNSWAKNVQINHQENFGKTRHVQQIKSTQVNEKR